MEQWHILWTVLIFLVSSGYGNPARQSYERTKEILQIVESIEEKINKEERLREITGIVHIDATMDKITKKLDRLIFFMESGSGHARISSGGSSVPILTDDTFSKLEVIDDRLERLENSVGKMEAVFGQVDFKKLDELHEASTKLQADLNQKLRKMMNVVTALYEMNKEEIKTNVGGRSEVPATQTADASPSYAADFFIENLEELERKIKEQFSVLTNDIRTEITGLKMVASTVSCDKTSDFDYDESAAGKSQPASNKRSSRREVAKRNKEVSIDNDIVDTIVQSLGQTSMEIRNEIHQGIQTIDHKLSNFTNRQQICGETGDLQASASVIEQSREPKDLPQEQSIEEKKSNKKQSCSKVSKSVSSPKSCADLKRGGATCDGVYVIFPKNIRAVRVFCDMTTDGGGWTVLMRRGDFGEKMTTFNKNWMSYKNGFGDVEGEFWLGNDVIHHLSTQDENTLLVELEAFDGDNINLTYTSFSVADEKDNYRLRVGPSLTPYVQASNGLRYHSNHLFSTFDRKNDAFEQNCASTYKGGWWFNGCYSGFLTGEYFKEADKREGWQGMLWYDWKGNAALKGAQMMIRPKSMP